MKNKQNKLAILFSLIFVIFLSLPAIGYFFHFAPGNSLIGYVDTESSKPEVLVKSWFDKKLQSYMEESVAQEIGFRALLIRVFNELSFRLFSEQKITDLYSTKQHGLYYKSSIAHLNEEYLNRHELTKTYDEFAKKLAEIQQLLAAKGKHFEVILSSSKAYVHLDGFDKRFLVNSFHTLYAEAASLGRELKKQGVNVIDSAPILREFYKKTAIETHANSSVHWNYYSGCIIAKYLFKDIRKTFANTPSLHCGKPIYKRADNLDLDGLIVLNVLSDVNIIKKTPYPSPSATFHDNYLPKMLVVSDSFMTQILTALDEAKSYSSIIISNYFLSSLKHRPGEFSPYMSPPPNEPITNTVLNEALEADVVILQMVDYNIPRLGYGFVEAFLKRLKEPAHEKQTL
jgi:hypothetical protein